MIIRHSLLLVSTCSVLLLANAGCVSLETEGEDVLVKPPVSEQKQGVYHKVKEGETLWRIAKGYGVGIDGITQVNNIPRAAQIEKDQLILIPGVDAVLEIEQEAQESANGFRWPLHGKVIKYFYSGQDEQISNGIDILANEGDEVRSAREGKVVFADYLNGYGYTVILEHSDGFHSIYAQNSETLVEVGDRVMSNSPIAHVGRKNRLAYVHFEIRKNTIVDNPLYYLP